MPNQQSQDKMHNLQVNDKEATAIMLALHASSADIDKQMLALASAPVSTFNLECLQEYFNKRKDLNKSILEKLSAYL